MGHSNGIITEPPSNLDVRAVLGIATLDVGSQCLSDNVNKWARNKPIRHSNPGEVSEAERKGMNYGFQFNTSNIPSTLVQGVTYLKPDGDWWKRLNDFIGYNHSAMPPMSGIGNVALSVLSRTETIFFQQQKGSLFDDLRLSEFPALANFYPCLVIFTRTTSGSSTFICKTGEYTFAEERELYIDITYNELSTFANKSLEYMLCGFSAKQTSLSGQQQVGQFISLPAEDALTGLITIRTGVAIEVVFTHITNRIVVGANDFKPLSIYSGAISIDGASARFGVQSTGDIALVARITNNENATYNMTRLGLNVEATATLVSNDPITGLKPSAMFEMAMSGSTGTATTVSDYVPLQIKPGETKWIGFNLDAIAYKKGAMTVIPSVDAEADIDIIFRLDNAFLGGVAQLRIKNGNSSKPGEITDPEPVEPIEPIL